MNAPDSDHSKFALALLALASASGLLLLGRITGDAWVSTTTWVVAAYMLGQPAAVLASGWAVQSAAKAKELLK